MFLISGWKAVSEIFSEVSGTLSFWHDGVFAGSVKEHEIDQASILDAWDCIANASKVGIVSQTGNVIPIKNPSITIFSNGHRRGYLFDLKYGTVGSGFENYQSHDSAMDVVEAQLRYGPFLYCPVVIDSPSFAEWFLSFETRVRSDAGYPGLAAQIEKSTTNDLPNQIVAIFQSGKLVKRDEIKKHLAPTMKHEEWKAHWSIAVDLLPELSKPGPRTTRRD